MRLLNNVNELITGFAQGLRTDCGRKLSRLRLTASTTLGLQTYAEVSAAYPGYIDDLDSEGAQGIVVVKTLQPRRVDDMMMKLWINSLTLELSVFCDD